MNLKRLLDEESSKKFQTFINYQKLNEFIKSDDKTKDNLIENYHEEFNKIFNILLGNIELPNEIKLIDEYIKCKKNVDINSQFQLIKNNFKIGTNICTYYFTYKNDSFIFFPKENKILKLKLDNDFEKYNRFYLEEYIENNKEIEMSYVKIIYSACQNNINIEIESNQIKDYYLINKKWLDSELQECSKIEYNNEIKILKEYIYETIKPEIIYSKYNNFSYPVDFYFIEKEKFHSEILELSRIFKIEAFPEYKILFVCDNNLQKEKKSIYVGLISNKDIKDNKLFVIYFYSVKYNEFEIEFIVKYYNEQMMYKEIRDNIMPNGIEVYLNIMSNNHENNNLEQKSLYDLNLNNIGFYINLNNKEINNIKITEYSKGLEYFPNTYFYSGIIQCLVNIKPLREIFLNKQFLINNKFIENSPITKKLYIIFQDKWYWTNNNEIYGSLINDIKNEDSNTFYNCKLLIEFLLLNIHNEQRKENNKNFVKLDSLKYNSEDEMKRDFYENNNTIIQKLFFFETMNYCKCEKCEIGDYVSYRINCVLEFELEINKKEITINDLLDSLSQMKECVICKKKSLQLVTTFSSFPQFLIMVIKNNHKLKDNFKHNDKIQIKNYFNGINEYELVSFIKNPPIKEENKEGVTYCKSPVNNEWYKYEGTKCGKTNINDIINNEKSIPYLLIYKNEYIENIYIKQYCSNSINEEIKSTTNL